MSHWAAKYIGLPWVFGAKGPSEFDCWGFAKHVQRVEYGIDMLELEYDRADWRAAAHELNHSEERKSWVRVDTPRDGDITTLARSRLPVHIGVWIRANGAEGVLHCLEGAGVVYQTARQLPLAGWGGLEYYRHRSKL